MSSAVINVCVIRKLVNKRMKEIEERRKIEESKAIKTEIERISKIRKFLNKISLGILKYKEPTRKEASDNLRYQFSFPSTFGWSTLDICKRLNNACDLTDLTTIIVDSEDLYQIRER